MHITILSSLTALLGGTLTLGNILLPVKIGHWEAANGIKRRELDRLSDCHPRPETELMYGLNQDEDSVLFGKVSLDAPLGMPIVLLERCESLISHVDCSVDGHISVTFRSAEAFLRVSRAWNFVNDEIDHKFLLIINHDECGSADDRHPYM